MTFRHAFEMLQQKIIDTLTSLCFADGDLADAVLFYFHERFLNCGSGSVSEVSGLLFLAGISGFFDN